MNDETNEKVRKLKEQYLKYFKPPATYDKDQYFQQVSGYDDSIPVYTSDSSVERKHA